MQQGRVSRMCSPVALKFSSVSPWRLLAQALVDFGFLGAWVQPKHLVK